MATFTKLALQPAGTTGTGLGIKVAATSGTGTAIHTGSSTATTIDEVWLYAVNASATAIKLTVQWGGTTAVDNDIELTVQPEAGLVTIAPGLLLQGNATARVVRAFAATADQIVIYGFVNRIAV
jgi:hypothetical protein